MLLKSLKYSKVQVKVQFVFYISALLLLYKAYRNTYKDIEMQSNQQKGQPLSFSFFYLNTPSPPPRQISRSFFLPPHWGRQGFTLQSFTANKRHHCFQKLAVVEPLDWLRRNITQHTFVLYVSLSVESDGNPSNDWFPSVKNTVCGQLHFRKQKTADLKVTSTSQPSLKCNGAKVKSIQKSKYSSKVQILKKFT